MTTPSALSALGRAGLLDGGTDAALDRLARDATRALGVPIAVVSLVDERRQHNPGMAGLSGWPAEQRGLPLSHSLCRHVVESRRPLVVADAETHAVARTAGAVTELGIRAYAGLPLVTSGGECVGALCAADRVPRAWSPRDLQQLRDLAVAATAELETRLADASLDDVTAEFRVQRRAAALRRAGRRALEALHRQGDWWMASVVTLGAVGALALLPENEAAKTVLAGLALAGYWAALLRRRTAHAAVTRRRLEAQTEALRVQVQATQASEARLRAVAAASPVGIFHSTLAGEITYANERAVQMWGVDEAAVLGLGWAEYVHADDRAALVEGWRAAMAADQDYEHEYRVVWSDGSVRHIRGRAAIARDGAGIATGTVGTVDDITAQREAREALVESERRFRTVVESIDQGLLITDDADRIMYANGRVASITGYDVDDLVGAGAVEVLMPPEEQPRFAERMRRRLGGESERYEVEIVRKDGTRVPTEMGAVPFRDASGAVVGTIGVIGDITARKALEAELRRQAFEDSLTGLANRARLRARMERALLRVDGSCAAAVLLVDLDDFKHVNDSLGHEAGDRLLSRVADRLLDATRGSDTVARLGGDEFAILLGAVAGERDATLVAERVVAALRAPFALQGREVRVGASVGVAVARAGDTPDELLRNADLALYRAKGGGKGRHATFAPEMHAAALERLELEAELRHAAAAGQLALQYQPIIELATGVVCGVEALVRWHHPTRGVVSPAAFIPIAEATGVIVPLGRWVLDAACRAAVTWPGGPDGAPPPHVSVNVSGRQLQDPGIVQDVAHALAASGLPPQRLVVEITESVLLDDLDTALARLEALRALGVSVALDDFGTGYSSLAYLQRLPVDVLKIDRAFTAHVTGEGRGSAFARAVLSFAATLGVRTVAEGVETVAQHAALRALGCAHGQGWLYARALDADAVARAVGARFVVVDEAPSCAASPVAAVVAA